MIQFLAKIFRGFHLIFGISAPPPGGNERAFVFAWLGGVDIHPSRHIDIRLFDANYYRTSFGTNANQNNYWISTGIILRLFNGNSD